MPTAAELAPLLPSDEVVLHEQLTDVAPLLPSDEGDLHEQLLSLRTGQLGSDEEVLALVGKDGKLEAVATNTLTFLVHSLTRSLKLVILNGCCTKRLANQLRSAGVEYVICWQTKVHDRAALIFAKSFVEKYLECEREGMNVAVNEAYKHARLKLEPREFSLRAVCGRAAVWRRREQQRLRCVQGRGGAIERLAL